MKKIFISLLLILVSLTSFAQSIMFRPNVMNVKPTIEEIETVYGDSQISFDLDDRKMNFAAIDGTDYNEKIVDQERLGNTLHVWTESAYYQLKYNVSPANKTPRLIMIMEFPYIGEVDYRQYYYAPKPAMSRQ